MTRQSGIPELLLRAKARQAFIGGAHVTSANKRVDGHNEPIVCSLVKSSSLPDDAQYSGQMTIHIGEIQL